MYVVRKDWYMFGGSFGYQHKHVLEAVSDDPHEDDDELGIVYGDVVCVWHSGVDLRLA